MEYKKINVLIVTYKQADVIGRNLDSILQQKEYGLNEIVICDDCSPDNNWDVIQSYAKKYPKYIRAYRNNPNLGIYGNSDKCASLCGDADLFCWLEGDDALCEGFFKAIQELINNYDIDVSQRIGIQADYLIIDANGNTRCIDNSYLGKHKCKPISARVRGLSTWRASVFSKPVIKSFTPTILDKGLALAESLFDNQWFQYTDKFYYTHVNGSIYYSGIGVSVNLNSKDCDFLTNESIVKWNYWIENSLSDRRDIFYAKSQIELAKLRTNQSFFTFCKYAHFSILGSWGYPFKIKRLFYPLRYVKTL